MDKALGERPMLGRAMNFRLLSLCPDAPELSTLCDRLAAGASGWRLLNARTVAEVLREHDLTRFDLSIVFWSREAPYRAEDLGELIAANPALPAIVVGEHIPERAARRLVRAGAQSVHDIHEITDHAFQLAIVTAIERAHWLRSFKRAARQDALTGALSRGCFEEALKNELTRCKRHDRSFGIAILDMNRLKYLNDTYGHRIGDTALKVCARWLESIVRSSDRVFRLGGDEFAILITDVDGDTDLQNITMRLEQQRELRLVAAGRRERFSMSYGVSQFPADGRNAVALVDRADARMYDCKRADKGRNRAMPSKRRAKLARNDR
ncbi:MAG: GGDEF domain-containing protein [Pseudomonadota bacterium]